MRQKMLNVIVGANGFSGSYIQAELLKRGEKTLALNHVGKGLFKENENVLFDVKNEDDISALSRRTAGCDARIIYLAFIHNPDIIKADPAAAAETNIMALGSFLKNVRFSEFYFYSSDTVYGESVGGKRFCETDVCVPINEYGRQKLEAERIVSDYGGKILRFSSLIGSSPVKGRHTFCDEIISALSCGAEIEMYDDFVRNMISYESAAKLTAALSEKNYASVPPILNLCGDSAISKYDMALNIARRKGLDEKLVKRAYIKDSHSFFERRAAAVLMDNSLAHSVLDFGDITYNGE